MSFYFSRLYQLIIPFLRIHVYTLLFVYSVLVFPPPPPSFFLLYSLFPPPPPLSPPLSPAVRYPSYHSLPINSLHFYILWLFIMLLLLLLFLQNIRLHNSSFKFTFL